MKTKEVPITARDGSGITATAKVLLCPQCGGTGNGAFYVYAVDGRHLHFQCWFCEETFCDNSCSEIL